MPVINSLSGASWHKESIPFLDAILAATTVEEVDAAVSRAFASDIASTQKQALKFVGDERKRDIKTPFLLRPWPLALMVSVIAYFAWKKSAQGLSGTPFYDSLKEALRKQSAGDLDGALVEARKARESALTNLERHDAQVLERKLRGEIVFRERQKRWSR